MLAESIAQKSRGTPQNVPLEKIQQKIAEKITVMPRLKPICLKSSETLSKLHFEELSPVVEPTLTVSENVAARIQVLVNFWSNGSCLGA